MTADELAKAYHGFFIKSQAGKTFMDTLHSFHNDNLDNAQETSDMNRLNKAAGNKEVLDHISLVISSADQAG